MQKLLRKENALTLRKKNTEEKLLITEKSRYLFKIRYFKKQNKKAIF